MGGCCVGDRLRHGGASGRASRAGGGWVRVGGVQGAKAPGAYWERVREPT